MRNIDILILYLSFGSAFGVHRFLQVRKLTPMGLLPAASAFFLWPILALTAVFERVHFFPTDKAFERTVILDSHLPDFASAQRSLEIALTEKSQGAAVFHLKDTLARYTGLTLARYSYYSPDAHGLLAFSDAPQKECQGICLERRNRNKLERHQRNARTEFVESVVDIVSTSEEFERVGAAALRFVKLLKDTEAEGLFSKRFDLIRQTRRTTPVPVMESNTWLTRDQQSTPQSL